LPPGAFFGSVAAMCAVITSRQRPTVSTVSEAYGSSASRVHQLDHVFPGVDDERVAAVRGAVRALVEVEQQRVLRKE
jgi:hypothetical protein